MEKFCEDHIECKEDTEETWTCTAHLDSGHPFKCPYVPSDIKYSILHGRQVPIKDNGYPCIDYRPVKPEFVKGNKMENEHLIHKYQNDPKFNRLVDVLANVLIIGAYTPDELKNELSEALPIAIEKFDYHQDIKG